MTDGLDFWMILPKRLISFLGADYYLMRKASTSVLKRFYLSSACILFITLFSIVSIFYAVELLFHTMFAEIFLSLFISLLFMLLYIFLINTISKNGSGKKQSFLTFSNFSRAGFILFMAFMISKPIEILSFSKPMDQDVELYKQQIKMEHNQKVAALFRADSLRLATTIERYVQFNKDGVFNEQLESIQTTLIELDEKKMRMILAASSAINNSSFFIHRVKLTFSKYPLCFIICVAVIIIFMLPFYLIYSISHDDDYFKMKAEKDNRIIERGWESFTERYTVLFRELHRIETSFFSVYEDPPFNLKRKQPPPCNSSGDFFNNYFNPE